MAYTQQRGTMMLNLRFPGGLRIQKASGTTDVKTYNAIKASLQKCYRIGNVDILNQVRNGLLRPMDVYSMDLNNQLRTTTTAVPNDTLQAAVLKHLAWRHSIGKLSDASLRNYTYAITLNIPEGAKISDAPRVLAKFQEQVTRRGKRKEQFNYTWKIVCGYFHKSPLFGTHTDLYRQVRAIGKIATKPTERVGYYYAQLLHVYGLLSPTHQQKFMSLLCSGMRSAEYQQIQGKSWEQLSDRIIVKGARYDDRDYVIPNIYPMTLADPDYNDFTDKLREAGKKLGMIVSPHTLRKSFQTLLDEAGVSPARIGVYMNHGGHTMYDLYKKVEVCNMLLQDAQMVKQYMRKVEKAHKP